MKQYNVSTRILAILVVVLAVALMALYIFRVSKIIRLPSTRSMPFAATIVGASPIRNDVVSPLEQKMDDMGPTEIFKLAEIYHYGRLGKAKDISLAVQYYNVSYHKGCHEAAIGLARLYSEGDEDIHMKPDGHKAVHMYMAALDHPTTRNPAILEIAELYANGLHPFYLPNKIVARQIYDIVLASSMFGLVAKDTCRERLLQTFDHIDPDTERTNTDIEYRSLPSDIVFTLKRKFLPKRHIPTLPQHTSPPTGITVTISDDDIMRNVVPLLNLTQVPEQQVFSKQNVHSSSLQNIAKKNLDMYERGGTSDTTYIEARDSFMSHLLEDKDTDIDKEAIVRVLDTLGTQHHTKYDRSEQDVFRTVWGRIDKCTDPQQKTNMVKSLSQSIASAVEHGYVVCSTGKITRMLGSLDAIDPDTQPMRPEWAIEREIADSAAKIRASYLEHAPPAEKHAYDSADPTHDQSALAKEVSNKMRETLLGKCKKDYVESGILGQEQLDIKIQTYLSAL